MRPLFVIGAQRSGTTILARLVAGHPDVFLTVNGKLLYYLIAWVYRSGETFPGLHLRLDEIVHAMARKPILGVAPEVVEEMLRMIGIMFPPERFASATAHEIVRAVWLETYARFGGDHAVIGDKYNEYLLQLDDIRELFPEARYLFIHRDPYDAAESMIHRFSGRPWAPRTMETALAKWAHWNERWLNVRDEVASADRMELAYEELVADPQGVFAAVCAFLGVPVSADYLRFVDASIDRSRVGVARRDRWHVRPSDAETFAHVTKVLGYDGAVAKGQLR